MKNVFKFKPDTDFSDKIKLFDSSFKEYYGDRFDTDLYGSNYVDLNNFIV